MQCGKEFLIKIIYRSWRNFWTNLDVISETCATTSKRSGRIYLFENYINLKRYKWIAFERYWRARECTLYLRSKKCRHAVWPSSSSLRIPFTDRLSHFSFAGGLPFGIVPSSFICLKDPFVHSSSSCFTCRILYAFPIPFFDHSSPIRDLANDDASRFVDETTITRYSVSTIRKWIFRERNSIHRTLRAVRLIELTYPRI